MGFTKSVLLVASLFLVLIQECRASGPFLAQVNSTTWVIGNDHWNLTQQRTLGKKLYYKGKDLVGDAWGHYASYNGAASNLNWTSAWVVSNTSTYTDIAFNATEGEMHWVIFPDLVGAYQYFVNHGLPDLGEFRTLWRLDNMSFPYGRTNIKDGALPPLELYQSNESTKVQDETWQLKNGTYITKYDWTAWIKEMDFHGVYGAEFGSWYISPGKDYFNGDHLKQELMVHRESSSGDAVQLNMLHGTHFQASSNDAFANGKIWGPWLWYLNNGSKEDAAARQKQEYAAWPYTWVQNAWYHNRADSVKGQIKLSDGRPAAGAAIFLGDNHPNKTALDQGSNYYYTTYADDQGAFQFENVLVGSYGLQAWSNGSKLANVSTSFLQNDIKISNTSSMDLGNFTWPLNNRTRIFQLGDFDRKALGFEYGGVPYQHGLVAKCPANLTFTIGKSRTEDWCFGQSAQGTWTINFDVDHVPVDKSAVLTVSLAGYSSGPTTSSIYVNGRGNKVGNMTSVASDPGLYRSATTAGEWHMYEFGFKGSLLKEGSNDVSFVVDKSKLWSGFMWDSILLEWA